MPRWATSGICPKSDFGIEVNGGVNIKYEPARTANRSKKAVSAIRKAVKEAEMVWLATDPDREGEAIAWHVAELVKLEPDDHAACDLQRDHQAGGHRGVRATRARST